MSPPEEAKIRCIGCGTMNPAGSEVCTGCGHRFAGPGGGINLQAIPAMRPEPDDYRLSQGRLVDKPLATGLGCFMKGVGVLVTIIASLVAFVVAFFATCSAMPQSDGVLIWSLMAGAGAVAVVIAAAVGFASLMRGGNR